VNGIIEYILGPDEIEKLRRGVKVLRGADDSPAAPEFYDRNWPAVEELPTGLRRVLERFRRTECDPVLLIHTLPVEDQELGPTPEHWTCAKDTGNSLDYELYLTMCGMALGEPFTWATLQSGRIVQDILPISGEETRQNGYGSEALLEFHTEDAFHPRRCDYLLLLGLRNHDQVATTVASVRDIELDERDRRILAERRYIIVPDAEHIRQLEERDPDHPALITMRRLRDRPEPVAVLFGDPRRSYLRIDRPFMTCVGNDPDAEGALERLMVELERVRRNVVVKPGTLLIVDNYLAVHGRKAFRSRYDGTDRWLKKITVHRNLRRGFVSAETDSHRVFA
jgi:Fe(II)/alpha-ketoglutarate-dependent arginine beta-hydroxylase